MKKTQFITILAITLAFLATASPMGASASEGKKGLNAVDVKVLVIKQEGDPIPDIDISIDQEPGGAVATGVLTNVFPPGNKRNTGEDQDCNEERASGIGHDTERNTGEDQDCDSDDQIDSAPEERARGNGIGHTLIIKRAEELPAIEVVLPRTKGTVKFFNEAKSFGRQIVDVLIKVNGQDI
ncbi:MAG: hypothetical protein Q8Q32_02615 [bacterium]|nr:hypothetical protein [bacterium]